MERRVNLVFGGGGMKSIAYCGVLTEMERRGIEIESFAGVSAGNFVGIAIAAGYTLMELAQLVSQTDFSKFAGNLVKATAGRATMHAQEKFLRRQINFTKEHVAIEIIRRRFGLEKGTVAREWLTNVLRRKNLSADLKFKDLQRDFRVFVYDVNDDAARVFSRKDTPEECVIEAILGSIALLPIFEPIKWHAPDGTIHLLADGGFVDICPMDIFDEDPKNEVATVGLLSIENCSAKNKPSRQITNVIESLSVIVGRTMKNQELRHMKEGRWNRVICIQSDISLLDFIAYGGNINTKMKLWRIGVSAASDFFERWGDALYAKN